MAYVANRRYRTAQAPYAGDIDSSENPYEPQDTPSYEGDSSPFGRPGGGYTPTRNPIGYKSGNDINANFVNDRDLTQGSGDALENEFSGDTSYRRNLEDRFGNEGYAAYQGLNQTPGYTPEEQAGIMRQDDLEGLRDGIDYHSNQLTPEEGDYIRGNPYKATDYLDPEGLNRTNDTSRERLMGGAENTERKLGANVDRTRTDMSAAVDPSKLGQSQEYRDWTGAVMNTTGDRVWNAATDDDLDMSGEYARQAGMTDQEVADTAAMGGQAVGAGSRAAIQDLERQAAASGNASPLAVAAARREFEDQNAVNSADAVVRAQLQARGAQREAAQGVENTRAAANRYKANAQMQAGMDLGNFAQSNLNWAEGNRQSGERDISNRQMDVAQTTGQMGDRDAMFTGAQNQSALEGDANRQIATGIHNETARTGIMERGENQASNREGMIATNRQATNVANQGNRFNRGYQTNNALSSRTQNVADARRQGQQEYRGYLTGQQTYQGQQGNVANQNRVTARGQTIQGRNQSTQGLGAYEIGQKNSRGTFDRVMDVGRLGLGVASMFKPKPAKDE